jgi:hypothetical protein
MADARSPGRTGESTQVSGALLAELRRVLAAHSGPSVDEGEVSRAIRAVALEARAKGIRAEQLVKSLKEVFDSLVPPPRIPPDERAKRLGYFVTTCVREYYAGDESDTPTS